MISEKIVVIDDNPKVATSLKMTLCEYEIIDFDGGQEALKYLNKPNGINLVLLDIFMKGMNGIDVLYELKENNPHISVIIITGFASQGLAVQALRNHADDFVEKPFVIEELKEKIFKILKKKLKFQKNVNSHLNKIERIKRFIERNFSSVTLEHVSNELCLSSKYVSRIFNEKNDSSFRDYKVKVKIDRAKSFLQDSSMNVGEISHELGYQNPESFMRIFKRMTSLTPMQYRKHAQNQ